MRVHAASRTSAIRSQLLIGQRVPGAAACCCDLADRSALDLAGSNASAYEERVPWAPSATYGL
jgi:hypothetical protein